MSQNAAYLHRFVEGKQKTTLLLLHGTGGDENDMLSLGRAISRDSSLLSPRGKILENGMPRFFRRLREGVFDTEDLKFRSGELADFVKKSSAKYHFDLNAVTAVGYSNGANIAASMILLDLFPFAGAILFRPMVPLTPSRLPNLKNTPVFVAAGSLDELVPRAETERLEALLRGAGAQVTLSWQAGGHALNSEEVQRATQWFDSRVLHRQHLKNQRKVNTLAKGEHA
jgi:predicted esterase